MAGVIFHKNDNLYNSRSISTIESYVDANNRDVAINVFLYGGNGGSGATWFAHDVCYATGTQQAYDDYLLYGNWGIENAIVGIAVHEIGHDLRLEHPKRWSDGDECLNDSSLCLDNCDDTPTYLELINDGYTNPYEWCNGEASNNLMDYNCVQRAWTPCQIDIVHTELESRTQLYPCGFEEDALLVTSNVSTANKSYIAKTFSISNVVVSESKALYINCETFKTTGQFEIESGAVLKINTAPKCN